MTRSTIITIAWLFFAGFSPGAEAVVERSSHWAYQPLIYHPPPRVRQSSWPRTEIDRFILASIEANQLRPAPDADKSTLIRRLSYDLTGLPPTPEQIDAFLHDQPPLAYEHLVDQLLASHHFGERWGRHWLDIARFAESVTLRGLVFSQAWRYRDYVIDAFNRDLPFTRFIAEQLAGDLLPYTALEDIHRARAATTYLVLGNFNYEEQDKDQLRMDIVDEQLDTIGKGFLGQTLGCARCHDHKFDPIPARDYYALAGILRNTKSAEHANVSTWIELPLPLPPEEEEKVREHERKLAELERDARKKVAEIAQITSGASQGRTPVSALAGVVIDDSQADRIGEWKQSQYNEPFIGDGYVHDDNTGKGSKTITFHPDLATAGKYEVRLAYTAGGNRATKVPVTILHAAGETTVYVNEKEAPPLQHHFVSLGQFQFERGNQGSVLIATTDTDGHVIADAIQFLPAEMIEAVKPDADPQVALLNKELEALRLEVKTATETGPKRPMVMTVQEEKQIEDARIHLRGSVHRLGEKVPRGFLSAAASVPACPLPATESGRRELAAWIASTNNPLTARVYVNRVWGWLFGNGIVRSPDNFGTTGDAPTHPELLDYLGLRFMKEGWSTKKLVREIVLSRAYQLSSHHPKLDGHDPENRLLTRASRRRLDAEALRDTILFISGNLDLAQGGSTVKPGATADFGYRDDSNRRSVYVPAFRNALPQIFELFDFADTSVVTGRRHASIVAPQALYFLNHPFIQEQARAAARRSRSIPSISISERINRMYRQTLGRPPTPPEIEIATRHLAGSSDALTAWSELYQALFASLDFRYLN